MGSAIARAIAKEGAKVFLAGKHLSSVKEVADDIATDENEVNAFVGLSGRAECPAGSFER